MGGFLRNYRYVWFLLVAAVLQVPSAQCWADTRVALVIGNTHYDHQPQLPSALGDAAAVAGVLRGVGFDVTLRTDASMGETLHAITDFTRKASNADWALIYFAGHGFQLNEASYLVPKDASLSDEDAIRTEAIPLNALRDAISGARDLRLIFLDACRDSGILDRMRFSQSTRAATRAGLAPVAHQESDEIILFAASDGTTAIDHIETGNGIHSPFAAALIETIPVPGLEVSKSLGRIGRLVRKSTNDRQVPQTWGTPSDEHDFYFVPPDTRRSLNSVKYAVVDSYKATYRVTGPGVALVTTTYSRLYGIKVGEISEGTEFGKHSPAAHGLRPRP